MSPKPAYEALMRMVKKEWWTAPQDLVTDKDGRVKFHGFLGTYSAATDGGGAAFDVDKAGAAEAVISPR
jgi:hypothetical protein